MQPIFHRTNDSCITFLGYKEAKMPMNYRAIIALSMCLGIMGCSGLTQLQDTTSNFDKGAHSLATAQMTFLRQLQLADCANQFYSAAFAFSIKQTDVLDLSGSCHPTIISPKEIAKRQALMDSITLYADKIQALATNDDNKTLETSSEKLAQKLNSQAESHSLLSELSIPQDVETAIIAVTNMVLDQRRFNDIRQAAKSLNHSLTNIVNALKAENLGFAAGMASKLTQIEPQLHTAVLTERNRIIDTCTNQCPITCKHKGADCVKRCAQICAANGASSFLDIISARQIIRAINPMLASPAPIASAKANPNGDPQNIAKQINASLDALLKANDALANAGTGGVVAAVNDLIARSKQANSILASLKP